MRRDPSLALVLTLLAGCGHSPQASSPRSEVATPVASDQSETSDDLAISRRIRQSLMADDTLSLAGKNVAIITAHGEVTLRGSVKTVREKAEIGVRAREIAGISHVGNLIDVKADAKAE